MSSASKNTYTIDLQPLATLDKQVADTMASVLELRTQVAELRTRLAKGTRDNLEPTIVQDPPSTERAPEPGRKDSQPIALLEGPATPRTITRPGRPHGPRYFIPPVQPGANTFNAGTEFSPRWYPRTGDDGPTPILAGLLRSILQERPWTLQEMIQATGARASRINGVLIQMQREAIGLTNLGSGRWFIIPPGTKVATLPPKGHQQ